VAAKSHKFPNYNFFYFLIVSIFFYIGYTIFATPLIGLGYEMTPDYNERTRLMAVSQFMGQIAWMIAPWFWVIIYEPINLRTAPQGAKNLSIWVGSLCMILGIMPGLFNKEKIVPDKIKWQIFRERVGCQYKRIYDWNKTHAEKQTFCKTLRGYLFHF
jgi:Na+/melibiose symporter-like transporter